jgi:superfamily II DNA or RNA helicase
MVAPVDRLRQNPGAVFPPEFCFRQPWREYQRRVLHDFERHTADGRFHVVAAPGSGKTVLGLEVVRRLGAPALVCVPTLALRRQWVERLSRHFLEEARPAWISEEVAAPALVTFDTYQALHACAKRQGVRVLAGTLRAAGVRTLVLDEAHHLKQDWWRTLAALHRALPETLVVALTATPPYDVPQAEWNRYLALAGTPDAEINVAELVLAGDLCPHQDYVHVQQPTPRESQRLAAFDARVASFLADLSLDRRLIEAARQHPALLDPEGHLDDLLHEPAYALSLAVFLRHAEGVVPPRLLEALGLEAAALPPLDRWWAERLLQGLLFSDARSLLGIADHLQDVRDRLRQLGALERRRVQLHGSASNRRALRSSPAKLRAVVDIVEAESRSLGEALRLVVLTERIREREAAAATAEAAAACRLGVVPLFDQLRRLQLPHVRLSAATGRLGIVPLALARELEAGLARASASPPAVAADPLAPGYARVPLSGEDVAAFVGVVTQAFEAGRLTAIVGTTALLGEGWDAPAINTLVLATTIGSYVSTNQSRGRALRRSPADPAKTANIWHPVCVEPGRQQDDEGELALLRRRFATFVGPGLEQATIESGLARLGFGSDGLPDTRALGAVNAAMFRHAEDRGRLAGLWRRALLPEGEGQGRQGRPVRETRLPRRLAPPLVIPLLSPRGRLAAWVGRWLLRRRMTGIVRALVESLRGEETAGASRQPGPTFEVRVDQERIVIRVLGLETRDEMRVQQALQDVFCPLFSPRYLLAGRRRAYPVPRSLGESRERAETLRRRWKRRVGRVRLVPTRTTEGKRLLLKCVERYLASHCRERIEVGTVWLAAPRASGRG